MSKKANPALIGGFVIGAIALLAGAAMIFGGSQAFKQTNRYVSYFEGSVKGLRVGSNVMFRGVQVGYVTEISLLASLDTLETLVPVVYEIDPEKFKFISDDKVIDSTAREARNVSVDDWIQVGLRAQLDSESFVTGQLMVELDFQPDTEVVFRNETLPYPEIPSIRSGVAQAIEDAQRFFAELQQEVDIAELGRKLNSILDGVDELANSEELRSALASIDAIVSNDSTQALPADLRKAINDLDVAVNSANGLINNLDANVVPAARSLAGTLDEAEQFLTEARRNIDGESALAVQLNDTLKDVSDAARSIRVLADYIEQHPEALIRGKK